MNKTQKIIMFATTVLLASNYDLFAMKRVAADNDDVQTDGAKRRRHTPAAPASAETKAPTVYALTSPAAAAKIETKTPEYVFDLAVINRDLARIEINNGYLEIQEKHGLGKPDNRQLVLVHRKKTQEPSIIGRRVYSFEPGEVILNWLHIDGADETNETPDNYNYRECRLGTLLILAALHDPIAKKNGCYKASVRAINKESQGLYRKLGFSNTGTKSSVDFETRNLQELLQKITKPYVEETFEKLKERARKDLEKKAAAAAPAAPVPAAPVPAAPVPAAPVPAAPASAETKAPTVYALTSPAAPAPAAAAKIETKTPEYVFDLTEINKRLAGITINNGYLQIQENHPIIQSKIVNKERQLDLVLIQKTNKIAVGKRTYTVGSSQVWLDRLDIFQVKGQYKYRRLGLGTLLILAALHDPIVVTNRCQRACVLAINQASTGLYKKLGFSNTGTESSLDFENHRLQEFLQEKTELLVEETFEKLNERALKDLEKKAALA